MFHGVRSSDTTRPDFRTRRDARPILLAAGTALTPFMTSSFGMVISLGTEPPTASVVGKLFGVRYLANLPIKEPKVVHAGA